MDEDYGVRSDEIATVLAVYLKVNLSYLVRNHYLISICLNCMMFIVYMCEVCHLFTLAVDAFRSEQIDGLLYQVRASTVEHPEPQILQKLCLSGRSVQLP